MSNIRTAYVLLSQYNVPSCAAIRTNTLNSINTKNLADGIYMNL